MNDSKDRSSTAAFHFPYRRMQMRKLTHVIRYRHPWYHELIWRRCDVIISENVWMILHTQPMLLRICCMDRNENVMNFLQAVAITQFKYQIAIVLLFIIGISLLNSLTVHFSLSACLLVASSRMDASPSLAHMPCIVIAGRPHWSPNDKAGLVVHLVTFINESAWSAVIPMPSAMNDY